MAITSPAPVEAQPKPKLMDKLLDQADANSRFVLLLQTATACICTLILTVGFLFIQERDVFPEMAIMVGGGLAGVAGLGRFFTKKAGNGLERTVELSKSENKT